MTNHHDISDQQLIAIHRRGEPWAFRELVRRHRAGVHGFIRSMLGSDDAADDVFQEVFIKVFNSLDRYDERGAFSAWLYGITNTTCIDHIRRNRRWSQTFTRWSATTPGNGNGSHRDEDHGGSLDDISNPDQMLPDKLLEIKEFQGLVSQAVDRLPVVQREVFLLRHHADLPFHEIASILGRPINTVLSQMRSSLLSLRSALREHYEYEPYNRPARSASLR